MGENCGKALLYELEVFDAMQAGERSSVLVLFARCVRVEYEDQEKLEGEVDEFCSWITLHAEVYRDTPGCWIVFEYLSAVLAGLPNERNMNRARNSLGAHNATGGSEVPYGPSVEASQE